MHELGHILDARYGLGDRDRQRDRQGSEAHRDPGKRAGQQVPDYKSEGKDAAKRRQTSRRAAPAREPPPRDARGVPSTKDLHDGPRYLHSGRREDGEHGRGVRECARPLPPRCARHFEIFDKIVGDHPELHALRDIEPSLSREEHGSTTRVPGIITGGHWYAPRGCGRCLAEPSVEGAGWQSDLRRCDRAGARRYADASGLLRLPRHRHRDRGRVLRLGARHRQPREQGRPT
jgi:hypothetical protein